MPQPPGKVFAAAPKTTTVKPVVHSSSTAALTIMPQLAPVPVPLSTMGPVQAVAATTRNSAVITNPVDGKLVYVGTDPTVSAATGAPLAPGTSLEIAGYTGPIYIISSNGGAQAFVSIT